MDDLCRLSATAAVDLLRRRKVSPLELLDAAAARIAETEPILNAIAQSGDLLDIGCVNGYLLESLLTRGQERGLEITPYGLDIGAGLIALARQCPPDPPNSI